MRKTSKRTVAFLLILAIAATTLFASPLKPRDGFGDAKVYDSSYKAQGSATEISDGFIIRTSKDTVILDNGTTHVELDPDSLAVFVSLENGVQIYILDGRMLVSSTSGDFTVMTTVTTYNAKSGSSIYVITDAKDELAFVSEGSAEALNFLMHTSTTVESGKYIDNSISGFEPSESSVASIWGEPKVEPQSAPEETKEPATEPKVVIPVSPLVRTFSYGNMKATLTAYQGYAELSYPSYITDEEIHAAAAAAAAAYPQYMDGIYYQIAGPGKAILYYPENYGEGELNLAMNLINAELPAYIAYLVKPQEPAEVAVVASEETSQVEQEQPAEQQQQPEQEPEQSVQTQPEKTPLETVPRPEPTPEPEPKKSDFSFGLWAGGLYGSGNDGNQFTEFPYTDGRFGIFAQNYRFFIRPYVKYKNFTFGLNAEAMFIDNTFQLENYKFDTESGITGYVNSVAKYISALGYESENFTLMFDMKSELKFQSPIFKSSDRLYATDENLLGRLNFNSGVFSLDGFVDDLKLTSKLEGRSQFAGLRAGLTFGNLNFGIGAIADFGKGLKETLVYPTADISFPFSLAGTRLSISAEGAAQIGFAEGFKLYGLMGKAMIGIGYGPMDIGFGAAYNKDRHFNNLITNAPVSTVAFKDGSSLDAFAKLKIDSKVFTFQTSLSLPISFEGGRFTNTVKTRCGDFIDLSADVFDLQMDLKLGGFTFTIGSSIYGFAGKVSDIIDVASEEEARNDAIKALVSPETSTIFSKLDFNTKVGPGTLDVFLRLDLMEVEHRLRFPLSIGASYSF